ncbi:hypothetical protein AeMF1_010315 [Aphanomyces euteiches]|nr:hypothetical protein AeMF1_010315 [Aphanomyces euteiches]KAH9190897.1 hypothetical protein AeNC1_007124 [Aphanomyces euteiches]
MYPPLPPYPPPPPPRDGEYTYRPMPQHPQMPHEPPRHHPDRYQPAHPQMPPHQLPSNHYYAHPSQSQDHRPAYSPPLLLPQAPSRDHYRETRMDNAPPPLPGYRPPPPIPNMMNHGQWQPPLPMNPPAQPYQYAPPPLPHQQAIQSPFPHQQARPPLQRPSIPPTSYVCHKCNQGGHWIEDCLKRPNQSSRPRPTEQMRGEWHCAPCEKHFSMKSQYDAHVLTHEQCWAPGCDFQASKRVVTSHYESTHRQTDGSKTGLQEIVVEGQTFQVLMGNSPEEIQKWREERRKKWPSESNVKRKMEQKEERAQAGDVTEPALKKAKPQPADNKEPAGDKESPVKKPKKRLKFCVKFIRSSCDLGDECPFNHNIQSVPCKSYSTTGKCKRGDKCNFAHTKTAAAVKQQAQTVAKQIAEHKTSLLRKLLAKDIDREQRHILQAFRHLIQHNFFLGDDNDI